MEVDWRRLFPLCDTHTWPCSPQEWEKGRNVPWVSERLDRLSSLTGRLEMAVLQGLCCVDATLPWRWGIRLEEYLHTLRVQEHLSVCISLSSLLLSQGPQTNTHKQTETHIESWNHSWFLYISHKFKQPCINTHLHAFPDRSVGVSGA